MEAELQDPSIVDSSSKGAFRKPSADAAHRKYRRHSPDDGSYSSDGSPKHGHNSSPPSLTDDPAKVSENQPRIKDDMREFDKGSDRNHYSKTNNSHRPSERHLSKSSRAYSKYDYYHRPDKHADDGEKDKCRRESRRTKDSSEYTRRESDHGSSRNSGERYYPDKYGSLGNRYKDKDTFSYGRDMYKDKYSSADRASSGGRHESLNSKKEMERHRQDSRDEKRDYYKRSRDYKIDHELPLSESREHKAARDFGHRFNEGEKEMESPQSPVKKPKISGFDKTTSYDKDAEEKQTSGLKQAKDVDGNAIQGLALKGVPEEASDLNTAKVAAMKAAELVNKNLAGFGAVGVLSTEQKKKLLWGNKKSTKIEEPAHHWDSALFEDRERQEKFNKLMGVKGDIHIVNKPENQEGGGLLVAEKQKELQQDLEKQYTAGLRRRDGRTVGLGL